MEYNRDVLIRVLIFHQHNEDSSCICGWAELGRSHPLHVVECYELAMQIEGEL